MVLISDDSTTTATLVSRNISSTTTLVTEDIIATPLIVDEIKAVETLSIEDTTKATLVPVNINTGSVFVFPESESVPSKIEEGLYLGSVKAATTKDTLKKLNITHILGVLVLSTPAYLDDFTYKTIEIHDNVNTNIVQYFEDCFNYIEEAKSRGGGVLVHCYMGMSRSATIVIAYMMKKHGMSLSEALELVKAKRPVVEPNRGFMLQLHQYEQALQGAKKALLRQLLKL